WHSVELGLAGRWLLGGWHFHARNPCLARGARRLVSIYLAFGQYHHSGRIHRRVAIHAVHHRLPRHVAASRRNGIYVLARSTWHAGDALCADRGQLNGTSPPASMRWVPPSRVGVVPPVPGSCAGGSHSELSQIAARCSRLLPRPPLRDPPQYHHRDEGIQHPGSPALCGGGYPSRVVVSHRARRYSCTGAARASADTG